MMSDDEVIDALHYIYIYIYINTSRAGFTGRRKRHKAGVLSPVLRNRRQTLITEETRSCVICYGGHTSFTVKDNPLFQAAVL